MSSNSNGRKVRCSSGLLGQNEYELQKAWPEGCFCQAGGRGIVMTKDGGYRTAFFEAFPRNPDSFIRGEGKTVEDAEEEAWNKWQAILHCSGHEYDRRNREDGYGYCKHCPHSGMVLEPTTNCHTCGKPAHYGQDKDGNWYCQEDYEPLPRDLWSKSRIELEQMERDMEEFDEKVKKDPAAFGRSLLGAVLAMEKIGDEIEEGKRQTSGIEDLANQISKEMETDEA